ncbi:cell division protein FtsA [Eubacteriales bacterium mix99]
MNNAIMAIDPGTTKMAVWVGHRNRDGSLELSGLGNVRYAGVSGDGWRSEGMMSRVLDDALGQAWNMAGFRVDHCTLGIPNEFCGLIRNTGGMTPDHPMSGQDIEELKKMAASYSLPSPWKISDVLYGGFRADGSRVGNPLGMERKRILLEASLICVNNDFAEQLTRIVTSRKIEVERILSVPLVCGEMFLSREEKQKGAVWIDVGGHSTDIVVYWKGIPVFFDWIPVGGENITQDIVAGTGVTSEQAEELKRHCILGLAREEEAAATEIPENGDSGATDVSPAFLQEIVEARVRELLEIVKGRIREEGLLTCCHSAVLAGGGISLLRGIRGLASGILAVPIRLGVPDMIGLSSPTLSAVYALGCSSPDKAGGTSKTIRTFIRKIKHRFSNFISF